MATDLTMFNYHRGRLRFLRMPFGAKMSQDVFQLCMDAILEQCPGVIGIHDDIVRIVAKRVSSFFLSEN